MTPSRALGAVMAGRILRRLLSGVEAVVYGPPSVVSGWFHDDPGYGVHDPLVTDPPGAGSDSVP
jgi:hypothetical protein